MNYYQEITLIDSTEVRFFELWSTFYTQLHLALVENAKASYGENATHSDIGVSFPEYKYCERKNSDNSIKTVATLGSKLRVFGDSKQVLEQLNLREKCERLEDYVHFKSIKAVPENITYVCVKRYRQKHNLEKIAAAFAEHKGISYEDALLHCQTYKQASKKLPFITIKSLHSDVTFTLDIEQTSTAKPLSGVFNTYGLSSTTTVPHWKN